MTSTIAVGHRFGSNPFQNRTDSTKPLFPTEPSYFKMLYLSRHLRTCCVVAVLAIIHVNVVVVAYRPSTLTNAPTSLTYDGGVTVVSTAASDAAVANYMRKRYGATTLDGGIPLSTMYPLPTTETIKDAGVATTEDALQLHRNKWGVDNQYAKEYWFDKRIHTLGNHGFWGAVHAAMAPMSTKVIDMAAYDGIDIRKEVSCCDLPVVIKFSDSSMGYLVSNICLRVPNVIHPQLSNELSKMIVGGNSNKMNNRSGFRIVDLCCGVGFSTRALRDAFPQPETTVIGVDTSPEMVR